MTGISKRMTLENCTLCDRTFSRAIFDFEGLVSGKILETSKKFCLLLQELLICLDSSTQKVVP